MRRTDLFYTEKRSTHFILEQKEEGASRLAHIFSNPLYAYHSTPQSAERDRAGGSHVTQNGGTVRPTIPSANVVFGRNVPTSDAGGGDRGRSPFQRTEYQISVDSR